MVVSKWTWNLCCIKIRTVLKKKSSTFSFHKIFENFSTIRTYYKRGKTVAKFIVILTKFCLVLVKLRNFHQELKTNFKKKLNPKLSQLIQILPNFIQILFWAYSNLENEKTRSLSFQIYITFTSTQTSKWNVQQLQHSTSRFLKSFAESMLSQISLSTINFTRYWGNVFGWTV